MKFYYYLMISAGIMFLMFLAGVDGIGTQTRALIVDSNDTIIQPTTQINGSVSGVESMVDRIRSSSTTLFDKILIALLGIASLVALGGFKIVGSSYNVDAQTVGKAIFAFGSFGIFASDMWTIVTLVFSYGVDWVSWFLAAIVFIYVLGFGISCIEFVGGTD